MIASNKSLTGHSVSPALSPSGHSVSLGNQPPGHSVSWALSLRALSLPGTQSSGHSVATPMPIIPKSKDSCNEYTGGRSIVLKQSVKKVNSFSSDRRTKSSRTSCLCKVCNQMAIRLKEGYAAQRRIYLRDQGGPQPPR